MADVDPLFAYHMLNPIGQTKAAEIADDFTTLLRSLEGRIALGGREGAIVRSKLEEACFYAKKCMALQALYQAVL